MLSMDHTKKIKIIVVLLINLVILNSCAKPTVVKTILPKDQKLNCEQLENEVAETEKIKKDAEYAKEGTGANITRMTLFWPAWARTLHNADVAIQAANDRNYHLIKLMKKKNCDGVDIINARIKKTSSTNNVAEQLKILKEMYDSDELTKEEYKKAKEKTLNN